MKPVVITLVTLMMAMSTNIAITLGGYWILSGTTFIGLLITMGVVSWDDGAPLVVWAAYIFVLALISAIIWPVIPIAVLAVGWRRPRETSKPIDVQAGDR